MKKRPNVYDNGGKTLDRYTIITSGRLQHRLGDYYEYIGASHTGAGYWQHGEIPAGLITRNGRVSFRHLGRRLKWDEVPEDIKERYRAEYENWNAPEGVFAIKEQPGGGFAFLHGQTKRGRARKYHVTWIGDEGPIDTRYCGTDMFVGRDTVRGRRREWPDVPPAVQKAFRLSLQSVTP